MTDPVNVPLWGIIILSAGASLGLLTFIVAVGCAFLFEMTHPASAAACKPPLAYEVVPVPPEHEAAFRQMWPLLPSWQQFAEAVLTNPDYTEHHEAVRKAARRFAAQYAGKLLFVKVSQMP
jgi:hypothetical protein